MIMNYITKIKANLSIYASKKTANILDGSYKSIYKGRSMDFDDLREYVVGDNIKDIDWKSSARSGTILIRRFIAEKKHNIMFVLDTGKKMLADTNSEEPKKEIAIMSTGILAYIANKNGDYVGAVYNKNDLISFNPFKQGLYNIEKILSSYEKDVEYDNSLTLEKALEYINNHIKRKMIIFVITDIDGMENVQDSTLKRLTLFNDVMFININDASMTGNSAYDIENNSYLPKLFLKDSKLHEVEENLKKELYLACTEKLKKHNISTTSIDSSTEVTIKIIDLLERHKHANIC